jgi:hypothetical protein
VFVCNFYAIFFFFLIQKSSVVCCIEKKKKEVKRNKFVAGIFRAEDYPRVRVGGCW